MANYDKTESFDRDLKRELRTIGKLWWTVAIAMLIGGLAGWLISKNVQPSYTATAVVLADPDFMPLRNQFPNFLLQNDQIKQQVVSTLGQEKFDQTEPPTYLLDRTDRSVVSIIVVSSDPFIASEAANAWANSAVEWLLSNIKVSEKLLEQKKTDLNLAEEELVNYLEQENLQKITWCEVTLITGVGNCDNQIFTDGADILSQVDASTRSEMTRLARNKVEKESIYKSQLASTAEKMIDPELRVMVASTASGAQLRHELLFSLLPVAGASATGITAVLLILIYSWWKNTQENPGIL